MEKNKNKNLKQKKKKKVNGALLEDINHWGTAFRVYSPTPLPGLLPMCGRTCDKQLPSSDFMIALNVVMLFLCGGLNPSKGKEGEGRGGFPERSKASSECV